MIDGTHYWSLKKMIALQRNKNILTESIISCGQWFLFETEKLPFIVSKICDIKKLPPNQ